MNDETKLLPCPFCGAVMDANPESNGWWQHPPTETCIAEHMLIAPDEVEAWNRRIDPPRSMSILNQCHINLRGADYLSVTPPDNSINVDIYNEGDRIFLHSDGHIDAKNLHILGPAAVADLRALAYAEGYAYASLLTGKEEQWSKE